MSIFKFIINSRFEYLQALSLRTVRWKPVLFVISWSLTQRSLLWQFFHRWRRFFSTLLRLEIQEKFVSSNFCAVQWYEVIASLRMVTKISDRVPSNGTKIASEQKNCKNVWQNLVNCGNEMKIFNLSVGFRSSKFGLRGWLQDWSCVEKCHPAYVGSFGVHL